jgi:hypothetical protein
MARKRFTTERIIGMLRGTVVRSPQRQSTFARNIEILCGPFCRGGIADTT